MTTETNPVKLATELTVAWLANPNTRTSVSDVPEFLRSMHDAVSKLSSASAAASEEAPVEEYPPAVSARKSLANKDHIISLIDGKPYKTLRGHLANHGLTAEEYRARYKLKADYPMVAENYSEARRSIAVMIGLGRKPQNRMKPTAEAPPLKPRTRKAKETKAAETSEA